MAERDVMSTEQVEAAKKRVLAAHPNAEVKSSDYGAHWIGLSPLSDFIEEDESQLDAIDGLPHETEEEIRYAIESRKDIEQKAIDAAWIDAASKLPTESKLTPEDGEKPNCKHCGRKEGLHAWINKFCLNEDMQHQTQTTFEPAQVESGEGLPPLKERLYSSNHERLAFQIGEREDQLKASLRRERELVELLRECIPQVDYKRTHTQTAEGRKNAARLLGHIKAAVTGE